MDASNFKETISSLNLKRKQLIDLIADILTVNEAGALVAKIHERTSPVSKSRRFGLYPIEDWQAFRRMKELEANFWTANEVVFQDDYNDFHALTPDEQKPLKMAFGFFAVGDGSIVNMLAHQMIITADTLEKQCWYVVQLNNERVHAETYGNMIYTLIDDPKEREEIFSAVDRVKSIKRMNEFIEESTTYPDGKKQLYVCLALAEFVMFIPLFCIIFWYRAYKRGKLTKIIFSNELIAKDEASHGQNGCENYQELPISEKYTDEEIWVVVEKVVTLVSDFTDEVLEDVILAELTPDNVKQYVRYVADDLLERLGHNKKYKVSNPFIWMNFTNLVPKTNFYEGVVGEYSRVNVQEAIDNAYKLCNNIPNHTNKENVYENAATMNF